jgi:hypothetical protein
MPNHKVEQGECLSSIAKKYGFADWHTIYDDAKNAKFRELRPNPTLIYPGDALWIPDKTQKHIEAPTGNKHVMKLTGRATRLLLVLKDEEGSAMPAVKYRLTVGDIVREGVTTGVGKVEQTIPADAPHGNLEIWPDGEERPSARWRLQLGHLDPVETLSGVQARLNNLGYYCGKVDGINGPRTKRAVEAFQTDNGLTVDGIAGPKTKGALKQVYGC